MNNFLSSKIEFLKGVGSSRAELLQKEFDIFTFNDLLFHFPYRHVDRSKIYKIAEIADENVYVQLKGAISKFKTIGIGKAQRLITELKDESGTIELIWFQGAKWIKESIKPGKEYLVFGKPSEFNKSYNIVHPTIDETIDAQGKLYLHIMPFYNASEKAKKRGLDTKAIMRLSNALINDSRFFIEENLPESLLKEYKLLNRNDALKQIHFPTNKQKLNEAEQRLKFEELFFTQLRLLKYKMKRHTIFNGIKIEKIGELFNVFYKDKLPFELTSAQKRVLKEIRVDMKSGKQMNRLLQGDVGSGKTVVALMSILMALDNNYQACMMAPTEILAKQHYNTVLKLINDLPIRVALLTGNTKKKDRNEILKLLQSGEIHILIGTHALIENDVEFQNLGIAIIDEQHRFGVEQRSKLWSKNKFAPHVLVMTATPIPRTLAMTLYGDLDTSVIDELPKGRKPIQTIHKYDSNRLAINGFIRDQISKGRQIYVVYPLIEESETMSYKNLNDGYDNICIEFPAPKYFVSMVHGKMKANEKEDSMKLFVKGSTNILVATTVIEVGVDVPNASVMIIESAEKFGLSQLHQLRGRVGRGADQSYCVLMTDFKLSSDARLRIKTMCNSNDGFEISEVDLKLRGPGELEGTIQSGILNMRIADITKDQQILAIARVAAQNILNNDPELKNAENGVLNNYLLNFQKGKKWGSIS